MKGLIIMKSTTIRKFISLAVAAALSFSCFAVSYADEAAVDVRTQYSATADDLYMKGLFNGSADYGFQLDEPATRVTAAVMLVRLLGAESDVTSNTYAHPYTDVQPWASNYIGYLYQNGIKFTEDPSTFDQSAKVTTTEFMKVVLTSLGYDVADFTADEVYQCAIATGLLTQAEAGSIVCVEFTRGAAAFILDNALHVSFADGSDTLLNKLTAEGAIQSKAAPTDQERYGLLGQPAARSVDSSIGNVITSTGKKYIGTRYVGGGRSPSGFDCSGFVGYTMIQSGVWSRYYGNCGGVASQCTFVSRANAVPGDIVFFSGTYASSSRYSHVGIYLGNGMMVHASSSKGVTIDSIDSKYWASHYAGIGRPNVLM